MSHHGQILVVEDNAQNYELVEFLLEDAGFSVRRAVDAEELRRGLMDQLPDLILMDIQLPGVDGLSLVTEIRSTPPAAGAETLPIVAITAHAMRGDRERFIAAGFNGYLSKPIEVATFVDSIRTFLDPVAANS